MNMTGRRFVLLLLLAAVFAAAPALAQVNLGPCSETVAKYCGDTVPGNGRIMRCLNDHRDDQSIACKDWVEDQQKNMRELMGVCTEEITVLCRMDPPDAARIFFCLSDNYVALKVDCRSKLAEIRDLLK